MSQLPPPPPPYFLYSWRRFVLYIHLIKYKPLFMSLPMKFYIPQSVRSAANNVQQLAVVKDNVKVVNHCLQGQHIGGELGDSRFPKNVMPNKPSINTEITFPVRLGESSSLENLQNNTWPPWELWFGLTLVRSVWKVWVHYHWQSRSTVKLLDPSLTHP